MNYVIIQSVNSLVHFLNHHKIWTFLNINDISQRLRNKGNKITQSARDWNNDSLAAIIVIYSSFLIKYIYTYICTGLL